ncbi:O-antigen ligase family protein [Desulfitobacterium sp.]|uniref:O-antigen ligase family protein n=1 Tax=Desulfitobacterium sp. TaxID=49981 RepID=UPI002CDB49AD|nr:O-antigen ligase family protein [Desulfitobacterium sp.]HVJ47998.1 O-antigen ligase family protein [Desulfitobacterium sp.]
MIGTTLNRDSRARDSKVRSLAFFLGFSVIVQGAFFPQEWLWLGAGLAFSLAGEAWSRVRIHGLSESEGIQGSLTITDGLLFTLICLSLLGLWHPIKLSEGWMDVIRWGTLWMVYHQARKIPRGLEQKKMLFWIEQVGVLLAILAWPLQLSLWVQGQGLFLTGTERLSSLLGYPNALAAYLAAVLLLRPRSKLVQALLFLSLLNTGSRAAVFLFLMVWSIRGLVRWRVRGTLTNLREGVFLGLLVISGLLLMIGFNQGAFQHLFDWRISNSLGERFLYVQDGLKLAWAHQGMPQAGGWFAFPVVQNIPYWTSDPHSILIRVLLNQGVYGVLALILWGILTFKQIGRVNKYRKSALSPDWDDRRPDSYSALLFLGLHAMMDADFLFGTLGILFWTLLGMFLPQQDRETSRFESQKAIKKTRLAPSIARTKAVGCTYAICPKLILSVSKINALNLRHFFQDIHFPYLKNQFMGLFFLLLSLTLLGSWVYPQWLDPQKSLGQETFKGKGDQQRSLQILQRGLEQDQTQLMVRREIASLELELYGAEGLDAAEDVLAWEKFDLRAYEWIQGRVLEEAEKRRSTNPGEALTLYRWSAKLPSRLQRLVSVSAFERRLWPDTVNFQPSELMNFFASAAQERQLTLR